MKNKGVYIISFILCQVFLLKPALAQVTDLEQGVYIRLLREFSVFLDVILLILIILLVIGLHGAFKYLRADDTWKNKLKIFFHFLSKEPALIFSQHGVKNNKGTYLHSFDDYKKFHSLSKKSFIRTVGLLVLQLLILAFLVYGLAFLTHYTSASDSTTMQSNYFLLQLGK
jgi:cytochrome bd-type quinol oxidase subunit 2